MKRIAAFLAAAAFIAPCFSTARAADSNDLFSQLSWRSIGPYIGGRVVAVAGVADQPNLFYMGGVQGGVWKSTDYGNEWTNISDATLPGIASPIGALAVAPSNANVIYAGTGEADIRGDFDSGDGVYKSTDAGKTWKYAGLRDTHMTTALAVDPRDANVAYASSMGHVFKGNAERGVFKTTDGGKSWKKILFINSDTGANQVLLDPRNPNIVYASMWQAQRVPWKLTSGGPGSGLFKSTDGGAHWVNISNHQGFASGTLGKMGLSVSQSNPNIVYAMVQAHDGGVFRSNDGGATWTHPNNQMKLRQRAFYYMAITVDPLNPNVAYVPQVDGLYKTTDGGKSWKAIADTIHGDQHIVWINPKHDNIMLLGTDGGATVSSDSGKTWSTLYNQPTGQFYKVALDGEFPFNVYGAQQDEGAYEGPSAFAQGGFIPLGEWHTVALGESTWVAPDPKNAAVTYGSGYYSSMAQLDRITGEQKNVPPWARYMPGNAAKDTKYRFGWTHPILFSQGDPNELLVGSQVVWSSKDRGWTWSAISPDLTRNDPSTEGPSGGSVDWDQTGAETFPDVASLGACPKNADVLWAGSADGLLHVTGDHGAHWSDVTPPALPQWAQFTSVECSGADSNTAYVTASRYMWDDFHPYLYRTTDLGKHWTAIANGIPSDEYAFVIRQDPREPRLLVAGTRSTVYVSFDAGDHWKPLTLNLPGVQVRDLAFNARQGMLVAATHGRSFWVLDNLAVLEQAARGTSLDSKELTLLQPEDAWLSHAYGGTNTEGSNGGDNPRYGASVFFNVPDSFDGRTPMVLSFLDSSGRVIRSFSLHLKKKHESAPTDAQKEEMDATQLRALDERKNSEVDHGGNVFVWNMRYAPAYDAPGFRVSPTDDFPDTGDGPTIVPGTYKVTLQYGASTLSQPLTVKLDPRLHPAAGDLDARLALETRLRDAMDSLDHSIAAALHARSHASAAKRMAIDKELDSLIQFDIHSSESDVLHPTKVREQLAFLMNSLENAYQKPTVAENAAADELTREASAGESALRSLLSP